MATKKRISDLGKELGIPNKLIIQKCLDEGVPADTVKSHTSVVSAGLELSIREWFSGGSVATAVETTEHVDAETLRSKPAGKARKGKTKDEHDQGEPADNGNAGEHAGEAKSEPPVDVTPSVTASAPAAVAEPPSQQDEDRAAATIVTRGRPAPASSGAAAPSAPAPRAIPAPAASAPPAAPAVTAAPAAAETTSAPTAAAPAAPGSASAAPAPATAAPAIKPATAASTGTGSAMKATAMPAAPAAQPAGATGAGGPSATTTGPAVAPTPPTGGASGPGTGGGSGGAVVTRPGPGLPPRIGPVRVAPMNVPERPKSVAPAGPQLQVKTPVKLAGPKVVRIETPEPVDPRGPRRPGGPGGGPGGPVMRGGRGVVPGPGGGDEADRSARRNKRRAPGPAETTARRRPGAPEDVPVGTGISEQDLIERENRLARAGGYLKQRRRELKARESGHGERATTAAERGGKVQINAPFTIKELAEVTGVKSAEIIKKLFMQGVAANLNSGMDPQKAQEVMLDFDIDLEVITQKTAEEVVSAAFTDRAKLDERARAPVVTIMGHVDHGKTSLLDKIRNTNVAAGEAGGITQKTSAFRVEVEVSGEKKPIVFLDTPGHQAFTEMRARGATLTDIVVLVVGAPEGVMPQTVESINHAKAAGVPIVVAINKVDSPQATEAQLNKVLRQLAEQGLNPVEWGGTTEVVKTSALKGVGIESLLEVLDIQAQVLELKADFAGPARGRVVEATLDEGRGPIATVMVQDGELKVGDCLVAGRAFGRVRDITNDRGERIKVATPSMPVQISGLDEVPDAGDPLFVAESLRKAQEAAQQRRDRDRLAALQQPKVTLDSLFSQMKDANVKEILIVLKADVQGSVDVIKHEVERLSTGEVKIRVLHAAVGGITESDVLLADASKAVIVGFNVIPTGKARTMADQKGVELRAYQVIYDITEDVKKAATGMLEPEIRQEVLGHAEVRKVFKVTGVGSIAGCYVTDGMVQRDALIRVTRQGVVIENDRVLDQLKRVKDHVKDVKLGMECGMKILGYDDIKEGDVLECYKKVEVKRTL